MTPERRPRPGDIGAANMRIVWERIAEHMPHFEGRAVGLDCYFGFAGCFSGIAHRARRHSKYIHSLHILSDIYTHDATSKYHYEDKDSSNNVPEQEHMERSNKPECSPNIHPQES